MRFSLIPRNYRFYDLFEKSARNLVLASEALTDLLEHFENVEMKTGRIKELERDGAEVTHALYLQLHRTFVTLLDHATPVPSSTSSRTRHAGRPGRPDDTNAGGG